MSATLGRPGPPGAVPTREMVMGQMGAENFPVASHLAGRRARRQLMAIYGFARLVDDIGDELAGDRLAALGRLEEQLDTVYAGGPGEHPVLQALARAIAERPLPRTAFQRLIEANRQDQAVSRYDTFDELLGYCQLSAAPIGELVLHVFGAATPERIGQSDRVCAGLQVIEHLQDIREDYSRGRVYLPRRDMLRYSCPESDLGAPSASAPLRELVRFEAARAGALLDAGAPLAGGLPLRARVAVAGFIAGGRAALGGIKQTGYDTLAARPGLPRMAFAAGWTKAMRGR